MNATTLASLAETTYDNIDTIHTEKDMESDDGSFSQSMLTFAAIMTLMIMIVGIIGNFLTVAALIKCPKVRNVAAAFIMSLCIADLLFCALVLPFSAYRFIEGTWEPRDILCKMIPFIQYGNIGVSLLCIAMITINRYIMITHHNSYAKIYKKHWIAAMIIFCWVFSYGMQLPTLVGAWGTFGYDPKLGTCSILSDDHGHSSKTTLFVTAFVIPCCIIIACYTKIFWVVHKSEQRMKRHANKQNSIPNNLRPPPGQSSQSGGSGGFGTLPSGNNLETGGGGCAGTQSRMSSDSSSSYSTDVKHEAVATTPKQTIRIKDQREVRARRNEWRITKMVLAIFLSFVICYLPITIAKVADQDVEHPNFHILSYIMLYLSACLNPIIYVIMNKQYRKAYKTVIMCQPSKFISGFVKHGNAGAAGGGGVGRGAAAGGGGIAKNGSSAAEKWKDIGLSQTHSQTMVSRMSAGDVLPTTISYSSSNTAPMEQPAAAMQTMEMSVNIPQLPAPPPPPPSVIMASSIDNKAAVAEKILNTEKAGVSTVSSNTNTPTVATLTTTPMTTTKLNGSNNNLAMKNTRITLVGGDIILEEEEDQEEQEMQQQLQKQITTTAIIEAAQQQQLKQNRPALPPQIQRKPQPQPRPAVPVYVNASALHQQKKSPYYGQNINVTAADNNNSMLTASSAAANNSSAANSKLVTKQKL